MEDTGLLSFRNSQQFLLTGTEFYSQSGLAFPACPQGPSQHHHLVLVVHEVPGALAWILYNIASEQWTRFTAKEVT